ncbi:MAG: DNA-binding protein [Coriobacteriia bacterium]|nr:DNA-binding protein [Coriobacteriia bacterium]
MAKPQFDPHEDLPDGLGSPALRALRRAGYTRLEQFTDVRESYLTRLHGMGAKAIGQIRVALAARGQSLAEENGERA